MRTFLDFVWADVQMTVRNKQALFWAFFFPVLLMGLMGVVFGQEDAFTAKLAIVDHDGGALAKGLAAAYGQVDALEVSDVQSETAALAALKDGDYAAVLVIPDGFTRDLAKGPVSLPYFFDNSSPQQAGTVAGVTTQVLQVYADVVTRSEPRLTVAARPVAAQGFDYIDFLVPGIIAMALMTNGIYGVSGTFVTYRQKGVLRRLRATPLPLPSFIGANVLVHLVRSLIMAALVLAVGIFAFGVNVATGGTLFKTAVLSIIGSGAFVTLGFFIAAVSKNVEIAAALGQVIGTPMMFLSGIFFPMDNAPAWIQPIVKLLPLTYLANGLRDVIIKGQSLMAVRLDIAVLTVTTVVFLGLSVRFFRWE